MMFQEPGAGGAPFFAATFGRTLQGRSGIRIALAACFIVVFSIEFMRTAWIGDDALITVRTVFNLLHGYGPVFNVGERVQAYTHPLWFGLLSLGAAITQNVYGTIYALSFVASAAALAFLMLRIARNPWAAAIGASMLMLSKAFVDYSTSGLESPLSHLLVLLVIYLGWKAAQKPGRSAFAFFLSVSFLYLNRSDLVLIAIPLGLLVFYRNSADWRRLSVALAAASVPVVLWTLFSLYYYGFPFPNTAYAKLGAGIGLDERITQGGAYLLDSLMRDPLTLTMIFIGCIIGAWAGLDALAVALGVVLYVGYVVSIGGDFMSGRFLTTPLVLAAALVSRFGASWRLGVSATLVALLGAITLPSTLLSGRDYANYVISTDGIADERGYWYWKNGLLQAGRAGLEQREWTFSSPGKPQIMCGGLGQEGVRLGPNIHIIDMCALSDPLLARLPAKFKPNWRIGHFVRQLPTDYEESVERRANLLSEPTARAYFDSIRLITHGKLNDPARFAEIFRMNVGLIDPPQPERFRMGVIPKSSNPAYGAGPALNENPTAKRDAQVSPGSPSASSGDR